MNTPDVPICWKCHGMGLVVEATTGQGYHIYVQCGQCAANRPRQ